MYLQNNFEDEMMINIRDYEQLNLLQLKFDASLLRNSS